LSRDGLRASHVTSSSSTSLGHASSGPVPLQLPLYRSQHQPPDPVPVTGLLGGQQPSSNLSAPVYGVPVHVAYKRPAVLSNEYGQLSGKRALFEPLKIDTDLKKVMFLGYPIVSFVRSDIVNINGLNSCYKTDREYSLAPTDDLIRFWRSKVKVTRSFKCGDRGILCRCWSFKVRLLVKYWSLASV